MPKLVIEDAPERTGSIYPEPYAAMMAGRSSRRLGDLAGLTQFGVNIVTLAPGAVASLRHWHLREDEFAIVLEGALVLVEEGGEVAMGPGDCVEGRRGERAPLRQPRGRGRAFSCCRQQVRRRMRHLCRCRHEDPFRAGWCATRHPS
jgi:mannose-6-phosphate isomerase-like protein (cupin superfamily)